MATTDSPQDQAQVLDLEELAPARQRIKFPGGTHYEVIHHNELGIVTLKDIHGRWERVGKMLADGSEEDLGAEEIAELSSALNALVRILVPGAPEPALESLNDRQRIAIVNFFYDTMPAREGSDGDAGPLSTSGS